MPEDRRPLHRWLPYVLPLVAAIAYASISIYRHDHFASNAFDLGNQDQTVWGYSRLQMIYNTVSMIRNLMGDHFHPILMSVAPLYWIWNDVRVLLIVQAVLLAVAGIPIFWWARQQLGLLPAILLQAAYLVFWGVLSGMIYDFHHIVFAVPAVSFALYAVLTRNNALFWPMLAVGLLTRENVALTFAAIGLYVLIVQRRWRLGLPVMAIGIAWFLVAVEVVIPAIAGAPYSHWYYEELGTGPASAVKHIVLHPIASLRVLFDNREKVKTWGGVVLTWLFLPVLSPIAIVAIPTMLERMWSSEPTLWTTHYHYSMILGPILSYAAIDTLHRIAPFLPVALRRLVPTGFALAALVMGSVLSFVLIRPLSEVTTYLSGSEAAEIQSCLNVIPPTASVSATNKLLPHLSHRYQIYLFNVKPEADYIALDPATNLGHFFLGERTQMRNVIKTDLADGYGVACSKGTTLVLSRESTSKSLSPEMTAFLDSRVP